MSHEYETHVVFRPDEPQMLRLRVESLSRGWRMSTLTSDSGNLPDRPGDIIATRHGPSLEESKSEINRLIDALDPLDTIVRVKIEHVVFDTKHGDRL